MKKHDQSCYNYVIFNYSNLKAIFFIAVFIPLILTAQFNFEPDTIPPIENKLGIPIPDSIKFEFRLWNYASVISIFTQLTLRQNNEWNYKTGFLNHNAELHYFDVSSSVDIPQLWRTLDSLGVRTLLSQDSVRASIIKDGRTYKLTPDQFDKFLATDAAAFEVELFNRNQYRTYHYISPIRLSDNFKNSKEKWVADEHHDMANIVRTVNSTFDIIISFQDYLRNSSNITIDIIQDGEETVYSIRDELLFALDPELLEKGNHTRESLQKLSRHWTYQEYIEFLNELKEWYTYPGIDIEILPPNQQSKADYQIKISFEAEIFRGGGIEIMTHTNFFQEGTEVFNQLSRRKIRKELRNKVKRR